MQKLDKVDAVEGVDDIRQYDTTSTPTTTGDISFIITSGANSFHLTESLEVVAGSSCGQQTALH
jgi:hypothetical protein